MSLIDTYSILWCLLVCIVYMYACSLLCIAIVLQLSLTHGYLPYGSSDALVRPLLHDTRCPALPCVPHCCVDIACPDMPPELCYVVLFHHAVNISVSVADDQCSVNMCVCAAIIIVAIIASSCRSFSSYLLCRSSCLQLPSLVAFVWATELLPRYGGVVDSGQYGLWLRECAAEA